MTIEDYRLICRGLSTDHLAPNRILYGPPGTGKTFHVVNKAVEIIDPLFYADNSSESKRDALKKRFDELVKKKRIRFVTFHQSYGYEQFVEGLKADTTKDHKLVYNVENGIFKQICSDAEEISAGEPFVLIIDEINRGNISKIFGELITLIEPSKRQSSDEALELVLPYSGDKFSVPKNVFIIGTMNTADRSLALMDTALRRRFDFEEMMPVANLLAGISIKGTKIDLVKLLEKINARIEALYDREHTLGHAFFLPLKDDPSLTKLGGIFENKIFPLLEEYFFEDWAKIRLVLGDFQKGKDDQFVRQKNVDYRRLFGKAESGLHDEKSYEVNIDAFKCEDAYIGIYKDLLKQKNSEAESTAGESE